MYSRVLKSASRMALLATLALAPVALLAQDAAKPAAKATTDDSISRWDIFAGYSYLAPIGTVNTLQGDYQTTLPFTYNSINYGATGSVARYFNKYAGLEVRGGFHPNENDINDGVYSVHAGPIFRYPTEEITPFFHVFAGGDRVTGPDFQPYKWGAAFGVGGGLDYATPFFHHHLSIRVFEYDFSLSHINYGGSDVVFGGRANPKFNELSTGVVYHVGGLKPPPPVTLTCKASPESVYPGEIINITGTAGALNPKLPVKYTWTGDSVTGDGSNAKADTATQSAGTYTVKGHVVEGPGVKPWQLADCSTTYTVKSFDPPTISCSASPSTIKPGESSTVTSVASSPQNRPLKISYTAAAGKIDGSGNSATFTAVEGTPIDTIGITCTVSDDKGHTVSANTAVTVAAPYVPPAPKTSDLCSISFGKKGQPIARVDNEAKACLDDVALNLQKQPDAKVVLVGEETSVEAKPKSKKAKPTSEIAAQRAVNTKAYLVDEKGIDASRISVSTDAGDAQQTKSVLVPAGAKYDASGTTPVDETKVKPQARKPIGAAAKPAKKKK